MSESLSLTSAITPTGPTVASYGIWSLYLGRGEGRIVVVVTDNNATRTTCAYEDTPGNPVATNLMVALNKANLTTASLQKRVLQQAVTDGKLPAGSVTGTVD